MEEIDERARVRTQRVKAKNEVHRTITKEPPTGGGALQSQAQFDPAVKQIIDSYDFSTSAEGPLNAKIVIVGDAGVGKTSLLLRLVEDSYFGPDVKKTIGIDYKTVNYTIFGGQISMCMWDTAGQERFRSLTTFYRGSDAALICFDLNRKYTLESAEGWLKQMKQIAGDIPCFLVGLKSDLAHEVDYLTGSLHAKKIGAEYWEVSAKVDVNVRELFDRCSMVVMEQVVRRWSENRGLRLQQEAAVTLRDTNKQETGWFGGCCGGWGSSSDDHSVQ